MDVTIAGFFAALLTLSVRADTVCVVGSLKEINKTEFKYKIKYNSAE